MTEKCLLKAQCEKTECEGDLDEKEICHNGVKECVDNRLLPESPTIQIEGRVLLNE